MKRHGYLAAGAIALLFCSCGGNGNGGYTGVVEGTSVQVPALTGGTLVERLIGEGDRVEAGAVMARIDTTELGYERRRLAAAIDEIAVREETARTARSRALGERNYLRERHERLSRLLDDDAVTRQAVDDAANALRNAESALDAASQQVRSVEAGRTQLEMRLLTIEKRIRDATITAPRGGMITEAYYEPGEAVPAMRAVFELIETAEVQVKIYVGEELLPSIAAGDEVRVIVDGLDRELAGLIEWISPEAEFTPKQILTPETRTSLVYAVEVSIRNASGVLKHGMPVEVRL